jgi:hypothetical protein
MKQFSITLAFVFALVLLSVHQARAGYLYGVLQAVQGDANGIGNTNIEWNVVDSTNSTLANSAPLEHLQAATRASYGDLNLTFNLDENWVATGPVFDGYVGLEAAWNDTVTISNATLNGTQGYLRPTLHFSAYVSASCNADGERSESQVGFYLIGMAPITGYVDAHSTNSPQVASIFLSAAGLADSNNLDNLDITFTYGVPFTIAFNLTLNTDGGLEDGTYAILNHHGNLNLQWQGAQVLDADKNPVSDFALTSDSGTDWTVSQALTGAALQIGGLNILNGTNLVINSTSGIPFNPVFLLTSTNLTLPMTNWVHLDTNSFDYTGSVSFTNAIRSGEPQRYYRLLSQ